METAYLPVDWVYREVIDELINSRTSGKIFFFDQDSKIDSEEGVVLKMEEIARQGIFIWLENGKSIRIDRIITIFGKPGAAYDEYNAFANSCMDCTGGYDKEELN